MPIRRGEIYIVDFDPVVGREIGGGKPRPAAVLSINAINVRPLVIAVVPGTRAAAKPVHFRNVVLVQPSRTNGLRYPTIFQCHQVRAIDHQRVRSGPVGRLSHEDLLMVEDAVRFSLGLP